MAPHDECTYDLYPNEIDTLRNQSLNTEGNAIFSLSSDKFPVPFPESRT